MDRYRKSGLPIDEAMLTRELRSVTQNGFKFIWASDGRHELYNLQEDPDEKDNLVPRFPKIAEEMERTLDERSAALTAVGVLEPVQAMDEATRQKLRSLGYIQ
jgi:hypothetical protein